MCTWVLCFNTLTVPKTSDQSIKVDYFEYFFVSSARKITRPKRILCNYLCGLTGYIMTHDWSTLCLIKVVTQTGIPCQGLWNLNLLTPTKQTYFNWRLKVITSVGNTKTESSLKVSFNRESIPLTKLKTCNIYSLLIDEFRRKRSIQPACINKNGKQILI